MIQDYFRLAYQSAKHRKLRSWLTMIGIFIGIAAVVALISLSQGLKTAISTQFLKLGSDKLMVQATGSGFGPPGTDVSVPLTKADRDAIYQAKGVDLVVGRLLRMTKLQHDNEIKYTYVVSFPDNLREALLVNEVADYKADKGRILNYDDGYKVVLGPDFAQDFFEKELQVRDKIEINSKEFEVVGILKKSGNPQTDSSLVVPEEALRSVLNVPQEMDIINVKVQAGESLETVAENVQKELRNFRNVEKGKEDFSVQTPESLLNTLNTILLVIEGVLIGIAAISLFVGGIGIMNTMYTAVLERTKEIGIMKAIGARNREIMTVFLIESGMLGLVGGLIGALLGYGISKLVELIAFQVYQTSLIQADFNPLVMLGTLLFAFIIGALSGWYPARQAAKLKPVEALRQ
ncbi:MAG: ABC transporter permease [Candidatus Woesearchaeota archaeon]